MSKITKLFLTLCTWIVLAGNAFAVAPENGWWWNPSESGSGYAIERQGNSIFMAAFLYETSGAATWYATVLALQPDGTYKGDMTRYVGGKSLLGTYKAPTSTTVVATATASFTRPDIGTMTIVFPNGSANRTIPISRFAFASPSFEPSKGSFQSGWWWNDQESGTGYFIELQGTSAFIASFMYDTAGQPTWYASSSSLSGTNLLAGALDTYANGQALGGTYKSPTANAGGAGSMSYGFTSDSLGSMTLPNASKVAIKRFVFDAGVASNHPPVPNAGPNQTVTVGDVVNLTGSGTDADGDPLTFSWRLLSAPTGSTTTINTWNTSKANFVADAAGTYRMELIADDGKVSNGGSVITVLANFKVNTNIAPFANAGANQYVSVGATVNLNGSASSDANGDMLTYAWTIISKPSGSTANLSASTTAFSSFTADVNGNYVVGLTVNDGKISSSQSSVNITAMISILVVQPSANVENASILCKETSSASSLNSDSIYNFTGLTSSWSNKSTIPGADANENFTIAFSNYSAIAKERNDSALKATLVSNLHRWANANAYQGSRLCWKPTTGWDPTCTQWVDPDGNDLSAIQDNNFIMEMVESLRRSYSLISDWSKTNDASKHAKIMEWLTFWDVNTPDPDPNNVFFGLGMGRYHWEIQRVKDASGIAATVPLVQRLMTGILPLINNDGSIVNRTTRGNRGLWYHYSSLNEIMTSMYLAQEASVTIDSVLEARLHKAVELFLNILDDPTYIVKWASAGYNNGGTGTLQNFNFAAWYDEPYAGSWIYLYANWYPSNSNTTRLKQKVPFATAKSASQDRQFGIALGCLLY